MTALLGSACSGSGDTVSGTMTGASIQSGGDVDAQVGTTGGVASGGGNVATGGASGGSVTGGDTAGIVDTGGTATGGSNASPCDGFPSDCVVVCQAGACDCQCPVAAGCRAQEPNSGEACNANELCTYGDDPACRHIYECDRGTWVVAGESCSDTTSGSCPATLAEAQAVPCIERTCAYDGYLCSCHYPQCTGIPTDPFTFCEQPPPAICQLSPTDGKSCFVEGQQCGPSCCGTQLTCTSGTWHAAMIACPP